MMDNFSYKCIKCKTDFNWKFSAYETYACSNCGELNTNRNVNNLYKYKGGKNIYSALSLNESGKYKNSLFTLIGCIQYHFKEYFENWWVLKIDNNKTIYLVENIYSYFICEEIELPNSPKLNISFSNPLDIKELGTFYTEMKAKVESVILFGYVSLIDRHYALESTLIANAEKLIYIKDFFEENKRKFYNIVPIKLDELNFENKVKPYEFSSVVTCNCENCKHKINLKYLPFTKNTVCTNCGTKYIVQNSKLIKKNSYGLNSLPELPIGAVFSFNNIQYEVIGWQKKQDDYSYSWMEYFLISNTDGIAFLSEYEGHWNFLTPENFHPVLVNEKDDFLIDNNYEYQLFNDYNAKIIHAGGEFLSDIYNDNKINVKEFICPPFMWSREININDKQITWFKGKYVSQQELRNATQTDLSLGYQNGVGATQPIKGYIRPNVLLQVALICIGLLVIGFFTSTYFNKNKTVYEVTHFQGDSTMYTEHVSPHFIIEKWRSNLEVIIQSPLSNNWLEVEMILVNTKTGATQNFEKGIEFYNGIEDGESWSEGKTKDNFYVSSLENGEYFIKYKAIQPSSYLDAPSFSITVINDVPMWGNFTIGIIISILLFVIYWLYMRHKDNQRWSNSPFYHLNQNDE